MADLTCFEVADSAPGYALDILPAELRARVAAHLIRCDDCRLSVSTMQDSAADLLDLGGGPAWEPAGWSQGWESGWEPESEPPPVRPARRRLRVAVSMAAAAVLLVGSAFGPELGMASHPGEKPVASALLVSGSQAVGTVNFYANHTDLDVEVDSLPASGRLNVVLTLADGTAVKIGEVQVDHGRGAWTGSGGSGATHMTGVALLDASYHEVASASVP